MIKAIIFDMDGVIVDSEPLWTEAFRNYFAERVPTTHTTARINNLHHDIRGKDWRIITAVIQKRCNLRDSRKQIMDGCARAGIKVFDTKLKPMPGAIPLIKKLSKHYPLALASSSPHTIIKYVLRRYKLKPYFIAALSGLDVRHGKPNPDLHLAAARILGARPDETVVFEDSANGIKAATRAGMKCIVLKQPYTPYSATKRAVRTVKDLRSITLPYIQSL